MSEAPKDTRRGSTPLMRALVIVGMVVFAFFLGFFQGYTSPPEAHIQLTEWIDFYPKQSPALNGLFVASNITLFILATVLGYRCVDVFMSRRAASDEAPTQGDAEA